MRYTRFLTHRRARKWPNRNIHPVRGTSRAKDRPPEFTGPKGETVAAVYGGFAGADDQAANARLIAAAPALLEYAEKRAGAGDQEANAIVAGVEKPVPEGE